VALVAALVVGCAGGGPQAPAGPDGPAVLGTAADALPAARVSIAGAALTLDLDVRVAADAEARAQGLAGVAELPEGTGMLFLFEADTTTGFWMRDTLVPLDLAFLDAQGRVVGVATMTPCPADPCPITAPPGPYRAALEAAAGVLSGLRAGDTVTWEPRGGSAG